VIVCKSPAEVERMRPANVLVADVLVEVRGMVGPGVTTAALDAFAERRVRAAGGVPAFKGYHGFPATLCISVNEEVIHGIPGPRALREGDIASIDLGVVLDGFFGDAAVTVPVGRISDEAAELLRVTEEALYLGIERARAGNRVSDIGHAVQRHVEAHGFSVVREFVGHGVGRTMHEEPQVPNYVDAKCNQKLRPGMTIAIEPMVNAGQPGVKILKDGWTVVTQDGSLSAHFEHTVLITEGEPEILTCTERLPSRLKVS